MKQKKRTFAAKRSLSELFPALLVVALGYGALRFADLFTSNELLNKSGWLFIILGVVSLWEFLVTRYEVSQSELIIRTGLSTTKIELQNIEALAMPRGWYRPLSRGQLKLRYQTLYRTRDLTVSPRDSQGFLVRLLDKCPWLAGPRFVMKP